MRGLGCVFTISSQQVWSGTCSADPEDATPCTEVRVLASGSKSTPASFTLSICAIRVQLNVVSLVSSNVPRGNNMAMIMPRSIPSVIPLALYELHSTQAPFCLFACNSNSGRQVELKTFSVHRRCFKSRSLLLYTDPAAMALLSAELVPLLISSQFTTSINKPVITTTIILN